MSSKETCLRKLPVNVFCRHLVRGLQPSHFRISESDILLCLLCPQTNFRFCLDNIQNCNTREVEEDWGIAKARELRGRLTGGHTPRPQLGLSLATEAAQPADGRAALENKLRQQ